MPSPERRSDLELRRRIDELLARVNAAREEIVEAGLDAVQDSRAADDTIRRGRFARAPKTSRDASSASAHRSRPDR
jgi:predicted translin family RNA/ssDNA-binding protein